MGELPTPGVQGCVTEPTGRRAEQPAEHDRAGDAGGGDDTPGLVFWEQAMKSKRVRWILAGVGVLLAAVIGYRLLSDGPKETKGRGQGDRAVTVTVAPVEKKDVPIELDGLGTVLPLSSVTLRTRVDGRLDSVTFKEGQDVKAGDVIAQIDPRPFQIQLEQARATLSRDSAQHRNAVKNLERYQGLLEQKLVSPQQVDDQRALAEQAAGVVGIDRAQVESAKLALDWTKVTSPIDGVTGVRQVDPGNLVHTSDPNGIVVITQLDPIAVMFTLPQDVLPQISAAMADGPLEVQAYGRDGSTLLATGQLSVVDNQINPSTATLRLKAQFPNPKHLLWPNAFVKARLKVTTRNDALVVPTVAVQRGPKGAFVYVVEPDSTAKLRPVQVETTEGELSLIRQGVAAGEQVVVEGQGQLRPGAKVQLKTPADGGQQKRAQVGP